MASQKVAPMSPAEFRRAFPSAIGRSDASAYLVAEASHQSDFAPEPPVPPDAGRVWRRWERPLWRDERVTVWWASLPVCKPGTLRVHLMRSPWSNWAERVIDAASAAEWRAQIVELTAYRYTAALEILDLDPTGRPFPVQEFTGADYPREVMSTDGFLVVRCGLDGARRAATHWDVLTRFARHRRRAEQFFETLGDFTRGAVYPPPRPVSNCGESQE